MSIHTTVIDCQATIDAGGCPWKAAYEASGVSEKGHVLGMFGTPCWFRGKVGEWAIDALGISDQVTFYGNLEDGTRKTAEDCLKTANITDAALTSPTTPDRVERYVRDGRPVPKDEEDVKDLVDANIAVAAYGSWWLRWVSNECDGADCWY